MFGFHKRRAEEPLEPVRVDLAEPDARARLREAAALWALGMAPSSEAVLVACELLAEGTDSPSLRAFAGMSLDEAWWQSRDVVAATFDELGLEFAERDSDDARLQVLRRMCRAFLRGELSVRDLGGWAHQMVGHEGPDVAQGLVVLDDEFDSGVPGWTQEQFATEATDRAHVFLAATA